MADQAKAASADAGSVRTAAVKLVGQAALKLASEKPEELEQLVSLTELLLKAEQNELRRGRLKLAQQHFDYEATAESFKEFSHFRSYMQVIREDDRLTNQQKVEKIERILEHWQKLKSRRAK